MLVPAGTPLGVYSRGELLGAFAHSAQPPAPFVLETEGITTHDSQVPIGHGAVPTVQRRESSSAARMPAQRRESPVRRRTPYSR